MKKIIVFLVATLFIATVTLPTVSAQPVIDQRQEIEDEVYFISNFHWQEFVPSKEKLLKVEVKVAQWFGGSPDMVLTIEKPLGNVLTSASVSAALIPSPNAGWVEFDVPDIKLTPGQKYVIKVTAPLGSEYGWAAGYGDPYSKGDSSMLPDCDDFCFRTYAPHGKAKSSIGAPLFLQWFFEKHPNLLPIMQILQKILLN